MSLYKYGQICPGVRSVGSMKATSTSFSLLTTLLTLTSCCFISDCPGRGKKRMLYSFRPGIPGQVSPETQESGAVDDQQLLDVPDKKYLSFLYDMPYRNFKPKAVNDQFLMNVPGKRDQRFRKRDLMKTKKDLRFLYDMLYNDNRQSKNLYPSSTQGGKKYIKLASS